MPEEHKYKSVQIKAPKEITNLVKGFQRMILSEDLAEGGLEDRPHITVLYGLDKLEGIDKLKHILNEYGSLNITLGTTKVFSGEEIERDYDVLYVEILGRDIVKAHLVLTSELTYVSTNPVFVPHMTLAYTKKGLAAPYLNCSYFGGKKFDAARLELADTDESINSFLIAGEKNGA